MDVIHISQFYSCAEVSLSSELYYICELGKYLTHNFGKALSIDGVVLNSVLKKSLFWDYFRVAVNKGWVVDTGLPSYETDITIQYPVDYATADFKNFLFILDECGYDAVDSAKRSSSLEYNYVTPKPTQVCFTNCTDDGWFWSIKGTCAKDEMINSSSLNSGCASQAWISMIAMVAVNRLMTGVPNKLGIEFPYVIVKNQLALSSFLLLVDETNAFTGWVIFSFEDNVSDDMQRQVGYEAWWYKGKEQGFLDRWYSPKEKLAYLKNNLGVDVGDVVIYYERSYSTAYNYIKSIKSCHLAIVRAITNTNITLEVINTVKTKYGAELTFKNQTMAVKEMYCGSKRYLDWNSSNQTIDLTDIGIRYLMHTEGSFITTLNDADDIVELDIKDDNERTGCYALHQNDVIYWLLKDYGIDFNEEKFLSTYFKDRETAYGVFMSGRNLPMEWVVKK